MTFPFILGALASLQAPTREVPTYTISAEPSLAETRRPVLAGVVAEVVAPELDDTAVSALVGWNRAGGRPKRIGVVRNLRASGKEAPTATAIRVTAVNSDYLRLNVECETGDVWVTGSAGETKTFSCLGVGTTWSPMVSGPDALVESTHPLQVIAVGEIVSPSALRIGTEDDNTYCLWDAACVSPEPYPGFTQDRTAMALIGFIDGSTVGVCSGGLLSDSAHDHIPYFLTANHCIGDAAVGSTVEAFWDYTPPSCGAPTPNLLAVPRSEGSTLMATSTSTDVTLLKLASVPGSRRMLGWDPGASSLTAGKNLYRVSFGAALTERYSSTTLDRSIACTTWKPPGWLFSRPRIGATAEGSSGSPVLYSDGQYSYVIGQLSGRCSAVGVDNCSQSNIIADGSFAASWTLLQPFLRPNTTPSQPGTCQPSSAMLCLSGNRFGVSVNWRDHSNNTGMGTAVPVNNGSGYFWFFTSSAIELVVKVLDGRAVNNKFWVFYGSLTDVEFTLTVQDMQTGRVKRYFNPSGQMASVGDTTALDP